MFTKISQDAFDELQVDAGVLLKNFTPANPSEPSDSDIITATTGGITVNCVPTFEDWGSDVDNCPNNLKEMKHITGYDCNIQLTALGTSPELIKLAIGAADIDGSDSTKIIPRRKLKSSDFTDLWWVGDKADGGLVAVKIKNALSTAGFSLKTTKDGKGNVSITLTGHVSVNAQDTMPMEFYSTEGEKLATLTVTSAAGETAGKTAITYTGYTKGSSESLKYKVADTVADVELDDVLTTGWTSWNGTDEITCDAGKKITLAVVVTATNKAKAAGSATTVINATSGTT